MRINKNPIPRTPVILFLAVVFEMASLSGRGQTTPINITTTAVPFLSISPDARSAGMGDMGMATAPDAWSGLHNGAKIPFAQAPTAIGVSYTPWLRDIVDNMYLLGAAGYHRLDENQALSASIRYFNLGDVPISDYSGNKLSVSHPREYSFDIGYSRKLSERLGIGLTARYIYSDLGAGDMSGTLYKAGTAVAGDVSLYYDGRSGGGGSAGLEGQGWTAGLVLSNLGSRISYTDDATARNFLPANMGIGVAYTGVANEDNRWTLSGEGNKLLVPELPGDSAGLADYHSMSILNSWGKSFNNAAYRFSIGGEYSYKELFFLRLGYSAQTREAGDEHYFTAGAGLKISTMGIDFSYLAPSGNGVTRNPLSNTFRLGLLFTFKDRH